MKVNDYLPADSRGSGDMMELRLILSSVSSTTDRRSLFLSESRLTASRGETTRWLATSPDQPWFASVQQIHT